MIAALVFVGATVGELLRYLADRRVQPPRLRNAVVTSVEIVFDGIPLPGTRTDIDNCSVLELKWGKEIVFCTGFPTVIDTLTLRTATLGDFPAHTPQTM